MGMCSGLLAQHCRRDQCPAWVSTPRAQKFHSIPYRSPHIHPQFGGKQWKPPHLTFPRTSSPKHCDVPHPSPRKGVTLGSPRPSLPHEETEEGTSSCSGPGRGVLPMGDTECREQCGGLPKRGYDWHWYPNPEMVPSPIQPVGIPACPVWNFWSSQYQTHTVPPKSTSTSHTLSARPEGTRSHVLPLDVGLICDTSGSFLLPNTTHGSARSQSPNSLCPTPALPPHSALHA